MKVYIQKQLNKVLYIIAALILCVITVIAGGVSTSPAFAASAESTAYSSVMDDLQKDENFTVSAYPLNTADNSLQVIQVAESTDKELFVYVYQPSGQAKNLRACSVNISTDELTAKAVSAASENEDENNEFHFYNYRLEFLNSSGVFFKYRVNNFTVKSDTTRYYSITSIYRPFDVNIGDIQAGNNNTITEVNYNISKQFCLVTENGGIAWTAKDIDTITVTDKFVGFCRYSDGYIMGVGHVIDCDSHFVAFNTDKPIDKLFEADVYYTQQDYTFTSYYPQGVNEEFGTVQDKYAYLKQENQITHTGKGLWAGTYSWNEIETVEQFLAENEQTQNVYSGAIINVNVANRITDEGKRALSGKKWVLRFTMTEFINTVSDAHISVGGQTQTVPDANIYKHSTLVGNVTILRLKFETDGVVYNLGVIDNKQTGSDKPINEETIQVEVKDWFKWLIGILLLIGLLILLLYLCPALIPVILKAVVWVICLPFKAIGALAKAIKKRKQEKKKANYTTKAISKTASKKVNNNGKKK